MENIVPLWSLRINNLFMAHNQSSNSGSIIHLSYRHFPLSFIYCTDSPNPAQASQQFLMRNQEESD